MSEWISIKDKYPELGQACMVAKHGEVLGFSQWGSKDIHFGGWVFIHAPMYAAWIGEEITHWMPLPEPPKDKPSHEGFLPGPEGLINTGGVTAYHA